MESIHKTSVESQVLDLFDKTAGIQGFRAVDVDCRVGARSLVRIYIERAGLDGPASASLDDCAEVSRLIDGALEAQDWFPGAYDLEISSPGMERRLRLESDFVSHLGEEVRVKLTESWQGKGAHWTGRIHAVENGNLSIALSKEVMTVPLASVTQANLVWKRPETLRPGKAHKGAGKAKGR